MRLSLQCDDLVLALHSSFEKALVFAIWRCSRGIALVFRKSTRLCDAMMLVFSMH
jgi:hypothetical protein